MTKISDLPDLPGALLGTDLIPVVRSGVNYKVAASVVKTFMNTDPTVVPASEPYRGALMRRTTSITGIAWPLLVTWSEAVYDTDEFWELAAPSRLTIPAGVTKVELSAGLIFEALATSGSVFIEFYKNGAQLADGGPLASARMGTTGFSTNTVSIHSAVLEVEAGDYFELRANASMSGQDQILAGVGTFFGIKVLEASS